VGSAFGQPTTSGLQGKGRGPYPGHHPGDRRWLLGFCSRYTATMAEKDFRSEAMESREGEGRARKAWDEVPGTAKLASPISLPVVGALARTRTEELLGFWLIWHFYGGFDGLERWGMNRATIFRKVGRFRQVYGEHPDVFQMPGVKIDVKAYWSGAADAAGRMSELRREMKGKQR